MAALPRYPTTDGPDGFGAPCPTTRPLLRSNDEADWQMVQQEAREAAAGAWLALQRAEAIYHRYGDTQFGELNRLSGCIMYLRRARTTLANIGDLATVRAKAARAAAIQERRTPLWLIRGKQEVQSWLKPS